jgi:hypothetical protein
VSATANSLVSVCRIGLDRVCVISAENPRLRRTFYDEPIHLPERWWRRSAGFLQLSAAYDDDRLRSERWRWPVRRVDGQHLDLLTRPDDVAHAIVEVAATTPRQHDEPLPSDGS